ncbi:ASCH domain-containing protein, partial [Pseudomonas aeruginosa]|nr:ASCH domain-containing protein [Pseudomonas aeruginosa]
MATLTLPLQRQYFEAIRDRRKPLEYRLVTPYWRKRLEGRTYDAIELTCGYPKRDDKARRITLPWKGYTIIENFTHPHFGPDPVTVFAINVAHYQIKPW